MDHKQTLDYLVENITPKAWTKFVRSRPDFFNWLIQQTPYKTNNISELIYLVKNPEQSPVCKFNKKRLFKNFFEGYRVGCGRHCECVIESQKNKLKNWHKNLTDEQKNQLVENAKKTFLEKYGVDNPMHDERCKNKLRQTNLKKYGVESPLLSKKIQEKIKQINLEKYGVESPLQNPEIQKKAQETYIKKYGKLMNAARLAREKKYGGVAWPEHIKEKAEKVKIEKYGAKSVFSLSEYRERINKKLHERLKEKYGKEIYDILYNRKKFISFVTGKSAYMVVKELNLKGDGSRIISLARKYNCLDVMKFEPQSVMEEDFASFLKENNINFKRNDKTVIAPLQLDFLFTDHSLAIEFHGLFHHSELSSKKFSTYHFNKYKKCLEKGIQLIQIYQDEYWEKKPIIYDMILCKLNLIKQKEDARKLVLKEISNKEANMFYELTHVSGTCFGSGLNVALIDENEIIYSCMSFQKIQNKFIILRFSNMLNTVIRGSFSKLLNHVIKKYSPKIIETYSDNRFSNGDLYKKHGFKMINESPPFYFVTDYNKRFYSKQFTRPKIKNRFGIDIENKTTWECIKEIGYDRIWDCGKKKWVLEL